MTELSQNKWCVPILTKLKPADNISEEIKEVSVAYDNRHCERRSVEVLNGASINFTANFDQSIFYLNVVDQIGNIDFFQYIHITNGKA